MKAYAHTKTNKQMFIVAIFLRAKTGKNLCVYHVWINCGIYLCGQILLSNKKAWAIDMGRNMDESQLCWVKEARQEYIVDTTSTYIKFKENKRTCDRKIV